MTNYVHGYTPKENQRLVDQATTLTELLHHDTAYPPGARVLEVGCGVGAQTVTLSKNSPQSQIVAIDIALDSLTAAQKRGSDNQVSNVVFQQADIFHLPFPDNAFDHLFVCFVLEHMPDPRVVLHHLQRVLKPGGSVTVIEGDHGSAYYHPRSENAQKTIQCLVDLQAQAGGNSLIGRELYPLLVRAGFQEVEVSPRMVYADASRPELVDGFTRRTFNAMVEGVREEALAQGMIDGATWEAGIADLYRTAEEDGTFCYTFFKGTGVWSQFA